MEHTGRSWGRWWLAALLIIIAAGCYTTWALKRSLPALAALPAAGSVTVRAPSGTLAWPAAGQAAVAIAGTPILETHGAQTAVPTASTAKLITALSVLKQKPLAPGQQGPTITLTDRDVALFNSYNAQGGSVVPVRAGEQISEYQALQALMLPSANNIADSLAIWAFGSLDNYARFANGYAGSLGLKSTRIGSDASGLAPDTVSSAQDLVKLGETAMADPVLASIVGQQTATGLPVVNTVKNVNFLLGTHDIVGVITGNSDEAGGVFVGAAHVTVNGKQATIVTAVTGSSTLFTAMKDSLNLITSAQANFKPVTIVRQNAVVGSYKVPWGGTIPAVAVDDLSVSGWAGSKVLYETSLGPVAGTAAAGQTAGSVTVPESAVTKQKSVAVKLQKSPGTPSAWWRLTHPF
jgi:D-alanyl-D-alanine carboxypeptidase (penicillin-binding protein 5/6)